MIRVDEFITDEDVSPFRRWLDDLDDQAAAVVTIAIDRLGEGNTSNAKSLGEGVSELRSIAVPAIESISAGTARCLSFCWAAAPKGGSRAISRRRCATGEPTRRASRPDGQRGADHAPDQKFSRDGAGAGAP
jgi:hypothetical protein